VAARTKTWVHSRPLIGTVGSNLDGGMDVCLVCVVRLRSLHRAHHSSRGALPSVVCLTECDREASIMWRPWSTTGYCVIGDAGEGGIGDRPQHASLIWTPSKIRLQVTWSATCKLHLDSLTNQATGDMVCNMQASSGLPHKSGYR
jgi:hypothetical protein